jgi:glycosyltransferase involved in cell wall biosynthesis
VRVTHLAPDPNTATQQAFPLPYDHFVLHVGNFYAYKNLHNLALACHQLREAGQDVGLVLVGRLHAPALALQAKLREAGIGEVTFTGQVTDAEREWLYRNADVYAFPSRSEGFGLPGLEAMARGLPVVSSNATCLPEVYGDAALYFDPRRVSDIAKALTKVLSSPELADHLRRRGLRRAAQFAWDKTARQTALAYSDALSSGRSPHA